MKDPKRKHVNGSTTEHRAKYYEENKEHIKRKSLAYFEANRQEVKAKQKAYRQRPEVKTKYNAKMRAALRTPDGNKRILLAGAKRRAKVRNLAFDITLDDFDIPTVCPVLGLTLAISTNGKSHCDTSPSLDQIIPGMGYIKGNVRVISWRANQLKSNATVHEALLIYQDLLRITVSHQSEHSQFSDSKTSTLKM